MPQKPSSPSEFFNALSNIDIAASQGPIPKGIDKIADVILKRIESNRTLKETAPLRQSQTLENLGLRVDPATQAGQDFMQTITPGAGQGAFTAKKEDPLISVNGLTPGAKTRAIQAGFLDFIPMAQARLLETAVKTEQAAADSATGLDLRQQGVALQKQTLAAQQEQNRQTLELRKQMLADAKDEKTRTRIDRLTAPHAKVLADPLSTPEQIKVANDSIAIINETEQLPDVQVEEKFFGADKVTVKPRESKAKAEETPAPAAEKQDGVTFEDSVVSAREAINSGVSRAAVLERLRKTFPDKAGRISQLFGD